MAGNKTTFHLSEEELLTLQQTKDFIESNLRQHHTITALAKRAHMNGTKLKAAFRELYGTGLFEHLQNCRMKKATELLLQTDQSVKRIGIEMGYPAWRNFLRAYKNYYGVTPGSLRKRT